MGTPVVSPSSELVVSSKSPLFTLMAEQYQMSAGSFFDTIVKTCFPADKQNPTLPQVAMFLSVAREYKLNPFTREIFAFVAKSGAVIPIVSVDGWVNLVTSHPQYDGVDFKYELENGRPVSTTCIMYRRGVSHPTPITEFFAECVRNNDIWSKWPRRMLRHKAYIQAARMAFGFSGIYDEDEGQRILEGDVVPEVKPAMIPLPQRVVAQPSGQQSAVSNQPEQNQALSDIMGGVGAAPAPEENLDAEPVAPELPPLADDLPNPFGPPVMREEDFKLEPPPQPPVQDVDFITNSELKRVMAIAKSGRFLGKTSSMAEEKIKEHCRVDSLSKIRKSDLDSLLAWCGSDSLKIR